MGVGVVVAVGDGVLVAVAVSVGVSVDNGTVLGVSVEMAKSDDCVAPVDGIATGVGAQAKRTSVAGKTKTQVRFIVVRVLLWRLRRPTICGLAYQL